MRSRSLAIRNGKVLLASGAIEALDVRTQRGRIAEIGARLRATVEIDARGGFVLPGLIDLHTHGLGRESVLSATLHEYARLEAAHGASTFFPTIFAAPNAAIACIQRHRRATDDLRALPQVGGFRLESPYLGYAGGGLSKDLAKITPETTRALLDAGGGCIRIWDISPELPGAIETIRALCALGIVCSLGHTQATIEEARAAVEAGARLVTHLFDTFLPPVMTQQGVYPAGLTDYLLTEDRVVCEIIGDGTHVHPLLVEVALRCKGGDGLAFVTDSNVGAALPDGEYTMHNDWGRILISGANNGVRLLDRNMDLAGSALTPIDAFRNAVRMFGRDLATASHLCSRTPARLMGLNKGEIAPGKDADLIIVDPALELCATVVGGQVAYQA